MPVVRFVASLAYCSPSAGNNAGDSEDVRDTDDHFTFLQLTDVSPDRLLQRHVPGGKLNISSPTPEYSLNHVVLSSFPFESALHHRT